MLDIVRTDLCEDGGVFSGDDASVDADAAWTALEKAAATGREVLLLGTSFALVELFDRTSDRAPIALAAGSRVMDTGGYKGRTRELTRDELVELVRERIGVGERWCENEYGMSELSSQAWLGTIARAVGRGLPG